MDRRIGPPCGVAFLILALAASGAEIKVGVGKRTITPDLAKFAPVYMAGFGMNRVATGIHDDIFVRCIAFSTGQKPVVVCGVDVIGIFWDDADKIRKQVAADVVVAALHPHEGPDTMGMWGPAIGKSGLNEAYNQFVVDQTVAAAQEALRGMQPAKIVLAKVNTPELDTFIDDSRPPVVHDPEIVLLRATDKSGQPIGTLLNWANHPEALGSRNTLITSDYSGYLRARLEELLGGTAVFVNGAIGGMQSPLGAAIRDPKTGENAPRDTFRFAEVLGVRVADMAAEAVRKAKPVKINSLQYREKMVDIPMANQQFVMASQSGVFQGRKKPNADGTSTSPVAFIRMSGAGKPQLEIVTVPGELYPELSVGGIQKYEGADYPDAPLEPAIKKLMKAPYRMLFGLTNDEIGYIIPKVEWDNQAPWLENAPKRWYGEVNSVGPEAAPIIVKAVGSLVQ